MSLEAHPTWVERAIAHLRWMFQELKTLENAEQPRRKLDISPPQLLIIIIIIIIIIN
jgi:hypothetical protein